MKNYFLFMLVPAFYSFGQTYSFDKIILTETTETDPGFQKLNNLTFANKENNNYVMYVNEYGGVIRDQDSEMIHIFDFASDTPTEQTYDFEYKHSMRMLKPSKFKKELYEVKKITDTEWVVTKFKNKRKNKTEYRYIIQLEVSPVDFLYLLFEKSIEKNNQIISLIRTQLDPAKKYTIKSCEFESQDKKGKSKFTLSDSLNLSIELPKKLKINTTL